MAALDPLVTPARAPLAGSASGDSDIVYAGFLRRFVALFLDQQVVVILILVPVLASGYRWHLFEGRLADTVDSGQSLYDLFWLLIAPLYYSLMESSRLQATLGKRALGIKVTDDRGQRISFRHALGRWVCAALSYLTLDIGFAMAGFTRRKRALHDIIAKTVVVDRWAFTGHPQRQQRTVTRGLVAAVVANLMVPVMAMAVSFAIIDVTLDKGLIAQMAGPDQESNGPQARQQPDQGLPQVTVADSPASPVTATAEVPSPASIEAAPLPEMPAATTPASFGEIADADLLTRAKLAQSDKRMDAPAGDNAIEYFLAYRARHPDNEGARAALTDLFPYAMIEAEQALQKAANAGAPGQAAQFRNEAARILALLERVDANAPSLPRLRTLLAQAGATATGNADAALPAGAAPSGSQPAGPDAYQTKSIEARGHDNVQAMLEQADAYKLHGTTSTQDIGRNLVNPPDASAVFLYRKVLSLQPGNPQAMKGLQDIAAFYEGIAQALCEKKQFAQCSQEAANGLQADPDDVRLKQLATQADDALRQETPQR